MKINLEKVPFTRKGAYLAVSKDPKHLGGGIWLRSLIRPEWGTGRKKVSDHIFRFLPLTYDGSFTDFEIECLPWEMSIKTEGGCIRFYFSSYDTLAISSENMGLAVEHDHDELIADVRDITAHSFESYLPVISCSTGIRAGWGSLEYDRALKRIFIIPAEGRIELSIKVCRKDIEAGESVKEEWDIEKTREDYRKFISSYSVDNEHSELAAYILWSSQYLSLGKITRRCNAASKSLMNLVWSWDNCFMALGAAKADIDLAWDNILLFFDLQCENGMLPDAVNPVVFVDWFTKPPVHGFTIRKLLEQGYMISREYKEKLYSGLKKWTDWWYRMLLYEGLVYYRHPFDSGWDNATFFDGGCPVASPDLNGYLIIQQDVLSSLAHDLGLKKEAVEWKRRADELLGNLISRMWKEDRFVCIGKSGEIIETNSLVRIMPVALGKRLPVYIMKALIEELSMENHFLTERGLATESVRSRLYDHRRGDMAKPNAYWRGPIWPPVIYLIVCGLMDAGENSLSYTILKRYINTVESNPEAMYENYDALTGEGNDDTSYGWTSAVYLLLKNQQRFLINIIKEDCSYEKSYIPVSNCHPGSCSSVDRLRRSEDGCPR